MSGLGAERVHAWGAAPGNTWQSEFPRQNSNDDGFERTSPVTAFAPNGYGRFRHDREYLDGTADWYAQKDVANAKACCVPQIRRRVRKPQAMIPASQTSRSPAR